MESEKDKLRRDIKEWITKFSAEKGESPHKLRRRQASARRPSSATIKSARRSVRLKRNSRPSFPCWMAVIWAVIWAVMWAVIWATVGLKGTRRYLDDISSVYVLYNSL